MAQGAAAARRPVIIAGALALALAGLAGCSKDAATPTPSSSPAPTSASATPTPTPTPTPAPTPPAKPANWASNDDAGALAAAQYFMDLFVYANATGDLSGWDAVSGPDCSFCKKTHDDVSNVYGSGGHIAGPVVTLTGATVVGSSATLNLRTVQFGYSTTTGTATDASGATTHTYPEEHGYLLLDVGWSGAGWALVEGDARDTAVSP